MQVVLLGTGTPTLDPTREHSALIVQNGSAMFLFDAGRGVTSNMLKVGLLPQNIGAVFITHHHYDHIGGLGEFLMTAWHSGRKTPLDVFGPQGTSAIVDALLNQVFARDIAYTLFDAPTEVDIRNIVRVTDVEPGWRAPYAGWVFAAEQVEHGHALGISHTEFPCLGYRLEAEGKIIAISGDTVACDGLDRLARDADVLIQCCYLARAEIVTPAIEKTAKMVIAGSDQVGQIATRNRVKKLVLTHFRPKSGEMMASLMQDVRSNFSGEIILGEDRMIIDI